MRLPSESSLASRECDLVLVLPSASLPPNCYARPPQSHRAPIALCRLLRQRLILTWPLPWRILHKPSHRQTRSQYNPPPSVRRKLTAASSATSDRQAVWANSR